PQTAPAVEVAIDLLDVAAQRLHLVRSGFGDVAHRRAIEGNPLVAAGDTPCQAPRARARDTRGATAAVRRRVGGGVDQKAAAVALSQRARFPLVRGVKPARARLQRVAERLTGFEQRRIAFEQRAVIHWANRSPA